ncbi:MAG TPA: hypothetical protein VFF73_41055 [Planctomycetota bacterium]|nr:hypothetical protein [Planctomycetota bacterium]
MTKNLTLAIERVKAQADTFAKALEEFGLAMDQESSVLRELINMREASADLRDFAESVVKFADLAMAAVTEEQRRKRPGLN